MEENYKEKHWFKKQFKTEYFDDLIKKLEKVKNAIIMPNKASVHFLIHTSALDELIVEVTFSDFWALS